ncbi:MAG: right-handed parallel beta-helix repeat-containing protein [Candidatus Eremiobacterota bacterium]
MKTNYVEFSDGSIVTGIEDLKAKFMSNNNDIVKIIENGDLELFFRNIADNIASMKEDGTNSQDIAGSVAFILGIPAVRSNAPSVTGKLPLSLLQEEIACDETVTREISLKNLLLSDKKFLTFPEDQWNLEDSITLKTEKEIKGNKSLFNINELIIDIPADKTLSFEQVTFKKNKKNEAVIKILNGSVLFYGIIFDGVRIETGGNSKVSICNSNFSHVNTAICGKEKSFIKSENLSFDRVHEKTIIMSDCADISNLYDLIKTYPSLKHSLAGSNTCGNKLLKESIIDFATFIKYCKHTVISGEYIINNTIEITGDICSIEGDNLIIKSNVKQAFLIKNNSTLKCKNIVFNYINEDIKKTQEKLEVLEDSNEEKQKEPGFIHVKAGNLEMNNCKITGANISVCLEEHSKADIKQCTIIKSIKNGMDIKSSKVKISDSILEGNGKEGKNYPQITVGDKSELEIKNSTISNSSDSDAIYFSESRGTIYKCYINNNNNGLDIREHSDVKVFDSELNGNREEGIYMYNNSKSVIKKCNIINNKSNGCDIRDNSEADIADSNINGNIRGIDIKSSRLQLSCCTLNGNVKGIYMEINSCGDIQNCTIKNSKMNGIYIDSSKVKLSDCEIKENGEKGEGTYQIYIGKKSRVELINNTVADASDKGQDIYSEFETSKLLMEDNTIEGNIVYGHKKNGCFITTATCLSLGKSDNCYELNRLRKFRDTWLIEQKDGERLIREYYSVAPLIVNTINTRADKHEIYKDIWDNYISLCLDLIEKEKFEEAKNLYIKLVEKYMGYGF